MSDQRFGPASDPAQIAAGKKRKRNGIPVGDSIDFREQKSDNNSQKQNRKPIAENDKPVSSRSPKKNFPPHLHSQDAHHSSKPRSGSLREKKEALLDVRKKLPI